MKILGYIVGALLLPVLVVLLIVVVAADTALTLLHVVPYRLRAHVTWPLIAALVDLAPEKWRRNRGTQNGGTET